MWASVPAAVSGTRGGAADPLTSGLRAPPPPRRRPDREWPGHMRRAAVDAGLLDPRREPPQEPLGGGGACACPGGGGGMPPTLVAGPGAREQGRGRWAIVLSSFAPFIYLKIS